MISNELLLTDTNSEFVRVRFEFVVIYFSIPAAPFGLLIPGARLDLLCLPSWCEGRRFSIIPAGFGCEVRMDVWMVIAVIDTKYEAIIHKIYLTLANIC